MKSTSPSWKAISYPMKWPEVVFLRYDWFENGSVPLLCPNAFDTKKVEYSLFSQSSPRNIFFGHLVGQEIGVLLGEANFVFKSIVHASFIAVGSGFTHGLIGHT